MTKEEIIQKWRKELKNTRKSREEFTEKYKSGMNQKSLLRIIGQLRQEERIFQSFIDDLDSMV